MQEILRKIEHDIAGEASRVPSTKNIALVAGNHPEPIELVHEDDTVGSSIFKAAPEPDPAPKTQVELAPPQPEAMNSMTDKQLLSDRAAGAAAAAFAQLAAVRREQRRAAEFLLSGVGDATLEDVVHELVRPMLGGWLDARLPEMIERLVQAEIAKTTEDVAA
jgi:cell pole-organizing protein PopZ